MAGIIGGYNVDDGTTQDALKQVTVSSDAATKKTAHDVAAYGKTATGLLLPLKVVDDGSGYGKLVCTVG
jgi:hypothetical protein